MGLTGFMMWNPLATVKLLPGEFIPAAKAAHGAEAILAVLAIFVWHMYAVHLKRFNKSMWTGRLTEEEMLHEHPLELADIKAGIAERRPPPALIRARQVIYYPLAVVTALALLFAVYGFVRGEETAITTVPPQLATVPVYVRRRRRPCHQRRHSRHRLRQLPPPRLLPRHGSGHVGAGRPDLCRWLYVVPWGCAGQRRFGFGYV